MQHTDFWVRGMSAGGGLRRAAAFFGLALLGSLTLSCGGPGGDPAKGIQTGPAIASISPNSGPNGGGTAVVITGTGFQSGATVAIGGVNASAVSVISGGQIQATTPTHASGVVDVAVKNPRGGGSATLTRGYAYTGLSVTSVSPSSGTASGGTTVTITGSSFQSGAGVRFGGVSAQSVVFLSSTQLQAVTPAHATGAVDVQVTNLDGSNGTLTGGYTYTAALAIQGVSPASGPVSGFTSVTIAGTGFEGGASVRFGSLLASSVSVNSATQIVAVTPASPAATVGVQVTNPGGASVSQSNGFTFTSALSASTISPAFGPASTASSVQIGGANFVAGTTVTFGATPSPSVTVIGSTLLQAVAPVQLAGTVSVLVTTPDGQNSTLNNAFTYMPLAVTSFTPTSGPNTGGTVVTVFGTNFLQGATVRFGGAPAPSSAVSGTTDIETTTPANVGGTVSVQVMNPGGEVATAPTTFSFDSQKAISTDPTISSILPNSGLTTGGLAVTITGTNFQSGATSAFGGFPSTNVTVQSGGQLTATVPARDPGVVDVIVTNPDGHFGTALGGFTYLGLAITSVAPNIGDTTGGTIVDIRGTDFQSGASVLFEGVPATSVTFVDITHLQARAPAFAAATVDLQVINPDGRTAVLTGGFTFVPPPTVGSLSRDVGSTAGGASLTITGTNFVNGATVAFGSAAVSSVTFVSSTSIRVVAPSHAAGTVDVKVTNPSGATFTLPSAFEYRPAPTTAYVQHDFEDGTLGRFFGDTCGAGCSVPVVTTEAAKSGTHSAKTAVTTGYLSRLEFRFCYGIGPNQSTSQPCNPPLVEPNGMYRRWYFMMPQSSIDAVVNSTLAGGHQLKLYSDRFNVDAGCSAPSCQSWVTGGFGANFGSQPLNQFNSTEASGVDAFSLANYFSKNNLVGGRWYEVEVFYKRNSATNTGKFKWWIDGKLQNESQDVGGLGDNNSSFQLTTWTGVVVVEGQGSNPVVVYVDDMKIANGFIDP